jgi:hypothetical protein
MSQEQYSTRLDEKEVRKIERYRDENNVSKAEALRDGVRKLEESDTSSEYIETLRQLVRTWGLVLGTGIVFLLVSEAGILPDFVTVLGGILLIPALAYSYLVS